MKRTIAILIICLMIMPSLGVISESTQKDYTYDHLRFMCTDGDGFNEAKYQQMVQMYESNKESQPMDEIESIIQESDPVKSVASDGGLMDSAWPMKCHDTKHTGLSPYSTSDNNGAELWRYKVNGWIQSGAVIDKEGNIYFGDYTGPFYVLNSNGSLKWIFDDFNMGSSITSTPTIGNDGIVYIGSWDHYLYALNPNGTLKWKYNARDTIACSPVLANDGTIYFGLMGPDEKGRVLALNPDGTKKWNYDTGYWITCDPAIGDDGTIYIGSGDTYFYALSPDGTLKWRYKTDHYIKGPASIDNDGTIYFGSYDDYLYALDPSGNLKWKLKIGSGTETNPSFGPDGTIYVGDDKLYAINPDGTYKWTFDLGNNRRIHQSSPAVSADGIIYVGTNIGESSGGEIIAVNPDGTERWRRKIANQWVDSSPCIGENGIVYVGSSSDLDVGYLYAFGPGDVNYPPNKPIIDGPTSGKIGHIYTYNITATDPDGDNISYTIVLDNENGSASSTHGPFFSGYTITMSTFWSQQGTYEIRAKAKDEQGLESEWSTLRVTMPKSKVSLWERLVERWPFFCRLLDYFEV